MRLRTALGVCLAVASLGVTTLGVPSSAGLTAVDQGRVLGRSLAPSAPLSATKVVADGVPGQVRFEWRTQGANTDFYVIETATTPWSQGARDRLRIKVPAHLRSYTLTPTQTARGGAGVGVGWGLAWRMKAVNVTKKKRYTRYFGNGHVRVPGLPTAGTGAALRVGSYNVRVDERFRERSRLIADQIRDVAPDVLLLQELYQSQVKDFQASLKAKDLEHYRLTRSTRIISSDTVMKLEARILYDSSRLELLSNCPADTSISCLIPFPSKAGWDHAAYARFRHRATGQEFWAVSFHLPNGSANSALRTEGMRVIAAAIERLNVAGLPVILGGDVNSHQLTPGHRPHDVLMDGGYYDTASTRKHVRVKFTTVNRYQHQSPSNFKVAPRIDLIATWGMPGSDRFVNHVIPKSDPLPSDHNLVTADVRLPEPATVTAGG